MEEAGTCHTRLIKNSSTGLGYPQKQKLIDNGLRCVFLIDMAGNIITNLDNGEKQHDIYSLAALAAGNFGAVSAMAKIIGENEFRCCFTRERKKTSTSTRSRRNFC